MSGLETWGLSAAVFLPLFGAIVIMRAAEGGRERAARPVPDVPVHRAPVDHRDRRSPCGSTSSHGGMQFDVDTSWIPSIGARYPHRPRRHLAAVVRPDLPRHVPVRHLRDAVDARTAATRVPFYALILLLTTGMAGTFVSLDLVLFFVFWELVLVPMYFLIAVWGSPGRREYAAIKFFLYTLFGSIFMLLGFIALYLRVGHPGRARRRAHVRHPAARGARRRPAAWSPLFGQPRLRSGCSSASRSRCRCGRSTRGSRTRIPRRRRSAR